MRRYFMHHIPVPPFMAIRGALLLLLISILISCGSPKLASEEDLLKQIEELGQMATVEFVVTKIIKASHEPDWYKWGERKFLISATATIKAGVNLEKLTENDIQIHNKSIELVLPSPEILSFNIRPQDLKLEFMRVSGLRHSFSSSETQSILQEAEKEIRAQIPQMGVLKTAEDNSRLFFQVWLSQMGFEQVNIRFDKQSSSKEEIRKQNAPALIRN